MKIRKKILINFSSPRLRRIKLSNFTSGWVQNHAKRETRDSTAATSIQERWSIPSLPSNAVLYQLEVKFDAFIHFKRGEEKLIKNLCFFSIFIREQHEDLIKHQKKVSLIHTLKSLSNELNFIGPQVLFDSMHEISKMSSTNFYV